MTFKDLSLHPQILKAIEDSGYTTPTPIQKQAIPEILKGIDLCASAQTGTGKTAAFILPALNRLITSNSNGHGPRILILVPTRELATQVTAQAIKYSKHLKIKTVCIYGGVPYPLQNKNLASNYEILVATPGRLIDHLERGKINFSRLEMLILDEADRMLDMGFIRPVEKIAASTPKSRQTLMFSATLKENVIKLSKHLLNNPVKIGIAPDFENSKQIEHRIYHTNNFSHKHKLLDHLLKDGSIAKAIVFTATKFCANQLCRQLIKQGFSAEALHGDINQNRRNRTIAKFRQEKTGLLIATDVAARGIDILTISHVINFDLPQTLDDYIHRIGRTGRAGGNGIAISFVSSKDRQLVKQIERFIGQKIVPLSIQGMEPSVSEYQKSDETDRPRHKRNFQPRSNNSFKFHKDKRQFFNPRKPNDTETESNLLEDSNKNDDRPRPRYRDKNKFNKDYKSKREFSEGSDIKESNMETTSNYSKYPSDRTDRPRYRDRNKFQRSNDFHKDYRPKREFSEGSDIKKSNMETTSNYSKYPSDRTDRPRYRDRNKFQRSNDFHTDRRPKRTFFDAGDVTNDRENRFNYSKYSDKNEKPRYRDTFQERSEDSFKDRRPKNKFFSDERKSNEDRYSKPKKGYSNASSKWKKPFPSYNKKRRDSF
jgi:superfamily II DNA/RNA helicase